MKLKEECCEKFKKKGTPCKRCPKFGMCLRNLLYRPQEHFPQVLSLAPMQAPPNQYSPPVNKVPQ